MSQPFLGEVKLVSFNFPPKGWAECNGQLLPINQNQALFSILGTTYGGDGRVTFGLPNLQGRTPVHVGGGIALGQSAGETAHTLITSELPAHMHQARGKSGTANTASPVGNTWVTQAANPFSNTVNTLMGPSTTSVMGGSQPHQNTQPYLVITIIIALQGIFPSRN
jgi:microcystin-dependent protein